MSRLREGRANTARGAAHFLRKTVGRVRYAGANGRLTLRADSGFHSWRGIRLPQDGCPLLHHHPPAQKPAQSHRGDTPDAWTPIPYWMDGAADVAETTCTPFQAEADAAPVRCHRPAGEADARFPTGPLRQIQLSWLHHRPGRGVARTGGWPSPPRRANAIRDLKYGVVNEPSPLGPLRRQRRLAGRPDGHNLARWTARIGLGERIATSPRPSGGGSSPWPDGLTRSARPPCIFRIAGLGLEVQPRLGPAASHSTPGLTAPSATDPPTGQPKIPADSCQPGPREFPAAYSLAIPRIAAPADGHRGPCAAIYVRVLPTPNGARLFPL